MKKKDILKYCDALDFESYRGRKITMDDEGTITPAHASYLRRKILGL